MEAHVATAAVAIFATFGSGTSGTISDRVVAPLFFLAVFAFLAVLSTVFWVGGIIWETWILPRDVTAWGPDLATAVAAAARRFRHVAAYALGLLFVADVGLAVAERVVVANGWMVSLPSLGWFGTILFDSRFGLLWYIHQVIVVLALAVTLAPGKGVTAFARLLLSVVLLLTFVVPWNTGPFSWGMVYTAAADLLFTVAVAAWLGGLLYVGYVLLPVMSAMSPLQRARMLAHSLPEFSRVAAAGGACVLVAGFLSSALQFIPWTEFLTTIYGRTLAVALELLVILLAMGAYHTLFLNPRLVEALSAQGMTSTHHASDDRVHDRGHALVGAAIRLYTMNTGKQSGIASEGSSEQPDLSPGPRDLEERLRAWLRREALLGGALLLAVVLLGIFAVSLLPSLAVADTSGGSHGPYVGTETVRQYMVTFKVSPDIFGANAFTVTLRDANGRPVAGASVQVETSSLDMDMGTQGVRLNEVGKEAPGSYTGQSELTMAGHWQAQVTCRLPSSRLPLTLDFQFSASY